jgi:O-antigen ligase
MYYHSSVAINIRNKVVLLVLYVTLLISVYFFYTKYVPLVKSFQMVFVPILILVFLVTAFRKSAGILLFVFCFPLINNLPYFFGIYEGVPHAPAALVLFIPFFFGWFLNSILTEDWINSNQALIKPMTMIVGILLVSGLITIFRHAHFFPVMSDRFHDLTVNVRGVTAGGAIMSTILSLLNYLSGFFFFLILCKSVPSRKFVVKILAVLSVSFFISLVFSLLQIYYSSSLGNTPFWNILGRINSTYKDPNAFGAILSSFFPVILGMLFFARKKFMRLWFFLIILLAFFVFPSIGSRSGLIGLGVSIVVFFLIFMSKLQTPLKKKMAYIAAIGVIIGILCVYFLFFAQHSNLYKRMGWSLDVLSEKNPFHKFFTKKLYYWDVAGKMVKAYPLSGVGLGNYIVELPNYTHEMKLPFKFTDSAENYFFHAGAELGLIGLALILWLIFIIVKQTYKNIGIFTPDNRERFIYYGLAAGIVSFLVNFMVHSYVGSFDTKYFFWLFVAAIFVFKKKTPEGSERKQKPAVSPKLIFSILIFLFAGVHMWHNSHSLSINERHEKLGWDLSFGLHQQETDPRGFAFHWTKQQAGICERLFGQLIVIPLRASHPDIEKSPVKVKIFQCDRYFNQVKLFDEVVLTDTSWIYKDYRVSDFEGDKIYLIFETDRVWQPMESLGVPDLRWLAVSIGKIWFEYPEELEGKKILRSERILNTRWEGKFKEKLWLRGTSKLRFRTDQKNVAFKLNVKPEMAYGLGPYILIRLDDRVIAKAMLNQEEWVSLVIQPEVHIGDHELSVEYLNDIHDPAQEEYRNIYLGDLEILYLK